MTDKRHPSWDDIAEMHEDLRRLDPAYRERADRKPSAYGPAGARPGPSKAALRWMIWRGWQLLARLDDEP